MTQKRADTKRIIRPKYILNANSTKEVKVDKALIDNFIALQRVMTTLSSKFDNLAEQISKLLQLFEISAKTLAKKEFETEKEISTNSSDMKKILDKLENISQQAGLIGKGLALIHETSLKKEPQTTEKYEDEHPLRKGAIPSIMSLKKENIKESPVYPVAQNIPSQIRPTQIKKFQTTNLSQKNKEKLTASENLPEDNPIDKEGKVDNT